MKVPDTTTLDINPNVRLKTMTDKKTLAKIEEFGLGWLNQKITGMDYRYVLEGHQDHVTSFVCFQKDKLHCMISVSWDQSVIVWDLNREMSHMKAQITEAHADCITW